MNGTIASVITSPKPITRRCIQPGGVWWELMSQTIGGHTYFYAELVKMGRLFWVTAAMDSPDEVQSYIARVYPTAHQYDGDNVNVSS